MDTESAKAAISSGRNWMQTAILLIVLFVLNGFDGSRSDSIQASISELSERMAGLEATVQGIDRRLDGIEGKLLRLENHIFKIEPQN